MKCSRFACNDAQPETQQRGIVGPNDYAARDEVNSQGLMMAEKARLEIEQDQEFCGSSADELFRRHQKLPV